MPGHRCSDAAVTPRSPWPSSPLPAPVSPADTCLARVLTAVILRHAQPRRKVVQRVRAEGRGGATGHVGGADGQGEVGVAKSARPVTWAGLPFGTAISRRFSVKIVGSPAGRPASVTTFICDSFALAKTSAGAPLVSWVANCELPAKA